jgi:hypothetical protein
MEEEKFSNNSYQRVTVLSAPISERYWSNGCDGLLNKGKIRVSGCWFDFDHRWVVEYSK